MGIKFSPIAEKAVKKYSKKVDDPKGFLKEDSANLKMYLAYRFQMDLEKLDEKDLSKKDQERLDSLKPYKQYVQDSVYKAVLNKAKLKWVKDTLKPMKVKLGKGKKDDEADAYEEAAEPVVIYRRQSRAGRMVGKAKNWVMDKLLAVSIAVNDILV